MIKILNFRKKINFVGSLQLPLLSNSIRFLYNIICPYDHHLYTSLLNIYGHCLLRKEEIFLKTFAFVLLTETNSSLSQTCTSFWFFRLLLSCIKKLNFHLYVLFNNFLIFYEIFYEKFFIFPTVNTTQLST